MVRCWFSAWGELWAVVKATVRDVGRQAEQPPDDWLDDRTILSYWSQTRHPRACVKPQFLPLRVPVDWRQAEHRRPGSVASREIPR